MKTACKLAVFIFLACAFGWSQATISSPTAGSIFTTTAVTFSWSAAPGASQYWLDIGSTQGGFNYAVSGFVSGTSVTLNLPSNGATVYATLWSDISGVWVHAPSSVQYTCFSTSTGLAVVQTPTYNSTITSSTPTFTWTAAPSAGADYYWIYLGSTAGSYNYYEAYVGNNLTYTLTYANFGYTGLPANGSTVYVSLYSDIAGVWYTPANPATYILASHYGALAWTASTGSDQAQTYNIYRADNLTGTSCTGTWNVEYTGIAASTACSGTSCSFNDNNTAGLTNLTLGETACWAVTAIDANGAESAKSNVVPGLIP